MSFGSCGGVAKHLQADRVTAKGVLETVCVLPRALKEMRSDEAADKLLEDAAVQREYGLKTHVKRCRYTRARLRHNSAVSREEPISEVNLQKVSCFEAIDMGLNGLTHRFSQDDLSLTAFRKIAENVRHLQPRKL